MRSNEGTTMLALIFLSVILGAVAYNPYDVPPGIVPEDFMGTWDLFRSENLDEYLEARGFSWIHRQAIENAHITKYIKKVRDNPPVYNIKIVNPRKEIDWTFQLGKTFTAEWVDDEEYEVKLTYNSVSYKIQVKLLNIVTGVVDIIEFYIDSNKNLVVRFDFGRVTARTYYQRIHNKEN